MFSPDKPLPPPPLPVKSRNESLAASTMSTYRQRPTAGTGGGDRQGDNNNAGSSASAFSVSAARAMFEAVKKPEVRQAITKAAQNPMLRNAAVSTAKNPQVQNAVRQAAKDPACRDAAISAAKNPEIRQWATSTAGSTNSASAAAAMIPTWPSSVGQQQPTTTLQKPTSLYPTVSDRGSTSNWSSPSYGSSKQSERSPPPAFDSWQTRETPAATRSSWEEPKKLDNSNRFNSIMSELESLNLGRSGVSTSNKIPPKRPPPPRVSPTSSSPSASTTGEPHALVKYPYNSAHVDELSCQPGDTVLLKKEVDDQWLYALNTRTGQYGIVPTVFLDVKVPLTPTPSRISMPTAFTGQQPKRPEPGSMPICVALFDYNTGVPGDLQFRVGERIQVSEKVDAEWLRGRTQTSAGYGIFPVNFVQLENQSPGKKSAVATPTTMPSYGVTALYDYNSGNPDDLVFKAGDVIEVVEKVGAEWLRGRLHGRMGLVPVTFVGESAGSPRSTAIPPSGSSLVGRMMVAQYDYSSAARDDLNFTKGDRIQITEEIDAEWLRGRLQLDMANQRSMPSGIFPRSYVA